MHEIFSDPENKRCVVEIEKPQHFNSQIQLLHMLSLWKIALNITIKLFINFLKDMNTSIKI